MFNIIEKQFKLNIETKQRKKELGNSPMVADCLREPSPPFRIAWSTLPILQRWRTRWVWWLKGAAKVDEWWYGWWVAARMEKYGEWWL